MPWLSLSKEDAERNDVCPGLRTHFTLRQRLIDELAANELCCCALESHYSELNKVPHSLIAFTLNIISVYRTIYIDLTKRCSYNMIFKKINKLSGFSLTIYKAA